MGFPRWRAAAAAAAVLAGLAGSALTATAASASTPAAVPSHATGRAAPRAAAGVLHDRLHAGLASLAGTAFGPVSGRGTDNEAASGTLGVFTFRGGSVNVHHTDVNNVTPKINLKACTATVFARGSWWFQGGTGKYRHAFGFGQFTFFQVTKMAGHKNGTCDTNPNDQPVSFSVKVTAWGQADSRRHGPLLTAGPGQR